MVVIPEKLSWLAMLLRVHGSVLPQIWRRVLVTTGLACVLTLLHMYLGWFTRSVPPLLFTVVGLALSIFLGFRNSTGYDRYWEGRKLWGGLVNTSRNFSRRILTLIHSERPEEAEQVRALQREMVYLVIAYVHSLRCHLRGDAYQTLAPLLTESDFVRLQAWSHPPLYLAQRLGESIALAHAHGWLNPLHVSLLEEPLSGLIDIQGGCERIKSTPIPLAYLILLHQLVAIYCLALPFGMVEGLDTYTPVVVMIVSYAFLGLDAIGDSIENPFELDDHDLPLSALSRSIEVNLRTQLGEVELPPLLQPDRSGLLM